MTKPWIPLLLQYNWKFNHSLTSGLHPYYGISDVL